MAAIGPLRIKLQLMCGDEWAMGPGKADLLEAIDREGSISAAGRALGMSYRRTWLLVDMMNRCWAEPLVETMAGGGRQRGARVSALGREVLDSYRALEASIAETVMPDPTAGKSAKPLARLAKRIRSEPRPSQRG